MRPRLHSHLAPGDLVPRHLHKIVLHPDTGLASKYGPGYGKCARILVCILGKRCVHISDMKESFSDTKCKHSLGGMLLTFRVSVKNFRRNRKQTTVTNIIHRQRMV